ncbi:type IX secretion system anionic LPS delivery protein PorZ [Vaginella massiliensis]|uniref:type IX secretion system anionic LPS delivery protein PorZ n=1 Tax=Vaginella massiliensis TaxID=1816680 RepID=UPI00083988CE|nr:T9SS type A sorting domain-containing protein [Vaginella massiliensis]
MKNLLYFLISISSLLHAQNTDTRWVDLFSYAHVSHIKEVDGILYCAAENGIFAFNPTTYETQKFSKVNLLHDVGITAMDYNAELGMMMIGYENGSIDILHDGKTKYILDIPWNTFQGSKAVNDIFIYDNKAMIAGDFGIASFSLERFEFIETTFFNENGKRLKVFETAVLGDDLYVASESGLHHSKLVDGVNYPNFNDARWTYLRKEEGFQHLSIYREEVIGNHWQNIFRINGKELPTLFSVDEFPKSLNVNGDYIAVGQNEEVVFWNGERDSKEIVLDKIEFETGIVLNGKFYGGTTHHGLIEFDNALMKENKKGFMPDGPYNNKSWSVTALNSKVWIAPGGATIDYSDVTANADGLFHFNGEKWMHFDSEKDFFGGKDLLHVTVNPLDDKQFFVSSWYEYDTSEKKNRIGGFEITMTDADQYNVNHITSPLTWRYRLGGAQYDENGDLYVVSSFAEESGETLWSSVSVSKRSGNSWQSKTVIQSKNRLTSARKPALDQTHLWIPGSRNGGVVVMDKQNLNHVYTIFTDNDLPSGNVWATAIDRSGTLWIGTDRGLRVLRSPSYAVESGDFMTEPIVISQDGLYEALLTDVKINSFKVDNANRKWTATSGSGAYYFSDNGEQTALHFTKKNSPLPSDEVKEIDVDPSTGYVYFATEKGVVAYRGDVGQTGEGFDNAYAYPNPVRPGFNGKVTIKGLPNRADVKITDVVGNLVYETRASGGIAEWDTRNLKGKLVASGIYLVLLTNQDGQETKTLKIAVVR